MLNDASLYKLFKAFGNFGRDELLLIRWWGEAPERPGVFAGSRIF